MLSQWLKEWPQVQDKIEELILGLKRHQILGSHRTAMHVVDLLRYILTTIQCTTAGECTDKVREIGYLLTKAHPHELAIGNVVRRVLYIIREEYMHAHNDKIPQSLENQILAQNKSMPRTYTAQRSLDTLLTPDKDTDLSRPVAELRTSILEGIAELMDEIENVHVNIADQAMEYIHTDEVILTYSKSTSVEEFLKTAAKKRQFKVIVVESAPILNGQQLAHSLATNGINVTVIPDSAVFAMMARVNKVVIPANAVVANGGLIAQSGLHNIALAAKKYSVPVVCVAGIIKLCPLYAHDIDVLNELVDPSALFNYESVSEEIEVLNPSSDYVPPELVDIYITNTGAHPPSYIYRLLAEYYSSQDYKLT